MQDLKYSLRLIARNPGFLVVALMAMAACWIPPCRATPVNPVVEWRHE